MSTSVFLIERLGHRGDGIAAGPAGPVYAARALPGERVAGAPEGGRIAAPRIVEASPERVAPPCPHYDACGGCQLQHASDGFVARWKTQVVRRALEAQGLPAPIRGIATSPPSSRRRAVLHARRLRAGALVGFHARASETLTPIDACLVVTPAILGARAAIADLARAGGSRAGALRAVATDGPAGIDLDVSGGKAACGALRADLAAIAAEHDLARLSWDGEPVAQARAPVQAMGPARVVPPPGAFLQATAHGQAALSASVLEALDGAQRAADLFAGCGTFALPLAARMPVHAVEGERAMVAALERGWRQATGLKAVSAEARDLFRRPLLAAELKAFDAVSIDPPRAGAEAQMREIAASGVRRVAAVSCHPASFARDAAILVRAGFALDWVRIVDQFRWSAHVELVARLSRAA